MKKNNDDSVGHDASHADDGSGQTTSSECGGSGTKTKTRKVGGDQNIFDILDF